MAADLLGVIFTSNGNGSCIFAIDLRAIGGIRQTEGVEPLFALFWTIKGQDISNIINANVGTIAERENNIINKQYQQKVKRLTYDLIKTRSADLRSRSRNHSIIWPDMRGADLYRENSL